MNWERILGAARDSFRDGVNDWIAHASIQGGIVNGPNAVIPPGAFVSTVQFQPLIHRALNAAGATSPVAGAIAGELWSAWMAWTDGFSASLPGAFPTLAAFPGPAAPLSRGVPFPLSKGNSIGEPRLTSKVLSQQLLRALRTHSKAAGFPAEKPVQVLAEWVESSFLEWKSRAQVVGVMGKGPVPTFAPPYVPVGPVAMGDVQGGGALGALIAGPRFGKIVL